MNEMNETLVVPLEIIEMIKDKPEIAYKLLSTTLGFTLLIQTKKEQSQTIIDNIIYKFIDGHEVDRTFNNKEIN